MPWDDADPPPLAAVPFHDLENGFPAKFYKFDMFHVLKHGLGREVCASSVMLLCRLGYMDEAGSSKNLPDRLSRCFGHFSLWCKAEHKVTFFKKFTLENFHATRNRFPYIGGKGSDCTLILHFLSFMVRLLLPDCKSADRIPLSCMLQCVESMLNFIGICHSHGLWLPNSCAAVAWRSGIKSLRAYSWLARFCMQKKLKLYALRPKFHSFAEMVYEMRGHTERGVQWVLSPVTYNCEMNEDFIGRISVLSRRVHTGLQIKRVLQRYGLQFKARLDELKSAQRRQLRAPQAGRKGRQ